MLNSFVKFVFCYFLLNYLVKKYFNNPIENRHFIVKQDLPVTAFLNNQKLDNSTVINNFKKEDLNNTILSVNYGNTLFKFPFVFKYFENKTTFNLLKQKEQKIEKEVEKHPLSGYFYCSEIVINSVQDEFITEIKQYPQIYENIVFYNASHVDFLYFNTFWCTKDKMTPIYQNNEAYLNISFSYYKMSLWKFSLIKQVNQSFHLQQDMFGIEGQEIDKIKVN